MEAVQTVSDLFLPLSGEIIEFNESLEEVPEKVNEDLIAKVRAIADKVEEWFIKFKDFFLNLGT